MANTVIQIKRSDATSAPAGGSLAVAEPAYSFSSDKLFLGNTAGTGVIEVGGKFYVDMTQAAYTQANNAYTTANAAATSTDVQSAFNTANQAFAKANTANTTADSAYGQANTARTHANSAYGQANTATTNAGLAYDQANTARTHANSAYGQANTATTNAGLAYDQANTARTHANSAYGQANTATTIGQAAFASSNTKFSSSGGTITGDVNIVGNLTLSGNTSFVNVSTYTVQDPLLYLASNNYSSDVVDIGFVANYVNATGSNVHTGFYREHTNKEYYLFYGYDKEPDNNHIDPTGNNFTIAVLNAHIRTSNLNLGGVNAITWITSAFNTANLAFTTANSGWAQANTGTTNAGLAYDQANTARNHANVGFGQANLAFTTANSGWAQANTALTTGQSAFATANLAFAKANGAAQNAFGTFTVGGVNIVADSNNDTLTITSGNGVILVADSGTDSFNIALSPTGVTATTYGSAASHAIFTVDAYGRITSASNVNIAIGASAITSGTLPVNRGGTGAGTFTTNGILYGQGTSALAVTAAGTEGQVLQASATGIPNFGMLDGGTF